MVQLSDIVDELEGWKDGRGVILRGSGDMFCSGGDLTLMKTLVASSRGTDMSNFMQNTLTRFYRLPLLSIAFVEGEFQIVLQLHFDGIQSLKSDF